MDASVCSQEPTSVYVWAHLFPHPHERYADSHHPCPASAVGISCAVGFHSQKATQKATEHFSWLVVRTITMNSTLHKKEFYENLGFI